MSIILDALKKSESDQQRQSGPALFEVKVAPPKARLPVWAIAIAVLLVVNMIVVGYFLLRRSHPDTTNAVANGDANSQASASNGAQPRQSYPSQGFGQPGEGGTNSNMSPNGTNAAGMGANGGRPYVPQGDGQYPSQGRADNNTGGRAQNANGQPYPGDGERDSGDQRSGGSGQYPGGGQQSAGSGPYSGGSQQSAGNGRYPGGGQQAAGGAQYPGGGQQAAGSAQYPGGGQQAAGNGQYSGGSQQFAGNGQYSGGGQQSAGGRPYPGGGQQAAGNGQYPGGSQQSAAGGQYPAGGQQAAGNGQYAGGNQQYSPQGGNQAFPNNGADGSPPANTTGVGSSEPTLANRGRNGASAQSGPPPNPDDYQPATEPESNSLFKGHVKRGTESGVPLYQDMAVVPGANLPELRLDLHVYAAQAQDRFALINMRKMHEGDTLQDGTRVESITPDGVIMSHNGAKFLLPRD